MGLVEPDLGGREMTEVYVSAITAALLVLPAVGASDSSSLFEVREHRSLSQGQYAEEPTLASDGRNKVWACWLSRDPGGTDSVWVCCSEAGRWSDPLRITSNDATREWPRIACAESGTPMVVWVRIQDGKWFLESSFYLKDRFSEPSPVGSGTGRAADPALAASKDGSFWLAWESYEKGAFRIRLSCFRNGKWGRPIDLTDGRTNSYNPALAVDESTGRIWVAYSAVDNRFERAIFLRCFDPRSGKLDPPVEIAVGGKVRNAPNRNDYPSVLCDESGAVWVAYEQESAARAQIPATCYHGKRECAVVCYRGGKLFHAKPSSADYGARDVLTGGEDFRPTLVRDAMGRLMLFSRMTRPAESYAKGEARTEYYYRVSVLDPSNGWTKPQTLLEGNQFTLGDLSRPAVAAAAGNEMWIAWQSDNIKYTGLFAKLEEFLPVVSSISAAKIALISDSAAAGPVGLEPTTAGSRTDLSAIESECRRGRPRIQRRVIESGGRKYTMITGNLHEHTSTPSSCMVPSADEGTYFDNYRYAADVHGYDFAALTDHDFGLYYDAAWRKALRAADFYDDPPYFCAIPAYEFSFINTTWGKQFQPARGSQILYFGSSESAMRFTKGARPYCQLDEETNDLKKLLSMLHNKGIKDAVLPPHQLTDFYSVTDWDIDDPEYRTVMEIFQVRGSYEYEGCPRQADVHFIPNTQEKAAGYERAWAQSALARGRRLGFIAAGDHKSTGTGTTVLFVKEVSRQGIIEAIKARRCYATTGDKIFIDFRIDGRLMGEEFHAAGKPHITAAVEGTAPLAGIVVFKNNKIIFEMKSEDLRSRKSTRVDFVDNEYCESSFYYLRVIQQDNEIAWSSPIWVDMPREDAARLSEGGGSLWDMNSVRRIPLDPELVCSKSKDGCKVEGIYITSGPNRVYLDFARPEKVEKPVPVFINLTGGGDNPDAALWLAQHLNCAVVDIEWRNPKAQHRSKWGCPADLSVWHIGSDVRDNIGYALVTAARRVLDYLATQPEIDSSRIACGGGSMGGYYSLLLAGVDSRVKCVFDTYGAGNLAKSGGRIAAGLSELAADRRRAWLAAFDPIHYAQCTSARTFLYLAANDFFFWLGDGIANYEALAGEKRMLIVPNYNHNLGAFDEQVPDCGWDWVRHCLHGLPAFPTVTDPRVRGRVYTWKAAGTVPITKSVLYWSPGRVKWPSRYWLPIPAARKGDAWTAAIPLEFADLAALVYVTVFDENGRAVSSRVISRPGIDPYKNPGPLWPGDSLWDMERGPAAWRPVGPAVTPGTAPASVERVGEGGLRIVPSPDEKRFSLLTNSVILAAGRAPEFRGIRMAVDGCGRGGTISITLQRESGSTTEVAYSTAAQYGPAETLIEVPWCVFKGPAGSAGSPHPFDGLRLDGERPDGSPLVIRKIELY